MAKKTLDILDRSIAYSIRLAEALRLAHKNLVTWKNVSEIHFDGKLAPGTLSRIALAKGKYLPTEKPIQKALGVYLVPKTLAGYPVKNLKYMIENRKEIN